MLTLRKIGDKFRVDQDTLIPDSGDTKLLFNLYRSLGSSVILAYGKFETGEFYTSMRICGHFCAHPENVHRNRCCLCSHERSKCLLCELRTHSTP